MKAWKAIREPSFTHARKSSGPLCRSCGLPLGHSVEAARSHVAKCARARELAKSDGVARQAAQALGAIGIDADECDG